MLALEQLAGRSDSCDSESRQGLLSAMTQARAEALAARPSAPAPSTMAGELHDFEPASSAFAVAQAVGEIPNALAPLDNKLPELVCSPCRSDVAFDDDRALAVDHRLSLIHI